MLLTQIEYFKAIVETQSFSKAAEICNITQSAISQQIKALEAELGVRLFDRHNRTFSTTKAGDVFYRNCLIVLSDVERMRQDTIREGRRDEEDGFVLRIGYNVCYGGPEFQNAVAEFAAKYPKIKMQITNGNHEDLYEALKNEKVDLILSDQRRAFSDEYENLELCESKTFVQIARSNPLSSREYLTADDLKNIPCVLVAEKEQEKNEADFYSGIIGFRGGFLFAENMQEARLLVAAGSGVMPVEGIRTETYFDSAINLVPLWRGGAQVSRKYCAFWKADNSGYYIEEFGDILKSQFALG